MLGITQRGYSPSQPYLQKPMGRSKPYRQSSNSYSSRSKYGKHDKYDRYKDYSDKEYTTITFEGDLGKDPSTIFNGLTIFPTIYQEQGFLFSLEDSPGASSVTPIGVVIGDENFTGNGIGVGDLERAAAEVSKPGGTRSGWSAGTNTDLVISRKYMLDFEFKSGYFTFAERRDTAGNSLATFTQDNVELLFEGYKDGQLVDSFTSKIPSNLRIHSKIDEEIDTLIIRDGDLNGWTLADNLKFEIDDEDIVVVDFEKAVLTNNTLVTTSYSQNGFVVTASSPDGSGGRDPDEFRIANADAAAAAGGPAVNDLTDALGADNQAAVAVRERDIIVQYFEHDDGEIEQEDFKFKGLYASRPASGTFTLEFKGYRNNSLVGSFQATVTSGGFIKSKIKGEIDTLVIDDNSSGAFAVDDLVFDV